MARTTYARVWPLKPGLTGVDVHGNPVELPLGRRGRMEFGEAKRQEQLGNLQLAAGKGLAELKAPVYETAAEAPEDLDSVVDEENEPPVARPAPKKKVVARKRYARRDMQAEKN